MSNEFSAGAIVYAKDVGRMSRFYAAVTGMEVVHEAADHTVLESETHEIVIVAIPAPVAARIVITSPPERRENTAVKLSFVVGDLAAARATARTHGGDLNAPSKEWRFQGLLVCDGCDPEGNMIQLRALPTDDIE